MEELLRKAEAYVSASNEHNLTRIKTMLARDCSYRSAGVGRHDGVEAIISMMKSFFASNPDVRWQAENYRWLSDCVVFDFLITLGGNTSSGVEEIHFNDDGKICRIVVQR
jgi:hypothetical protein